MYKSLDRPYVVLQIFLVERACTAQLYIININNKPH